MGESSKQRITSSGVEIHHRGRRDMHFGIPVPPALRMPRIAQVVQARKEAEMLSSENTKKRPSGRAGHDRFLSFPTSHLTSATSATHVYHKTCPRATYSSDLLSLGLSLPLSLSLSLVAQCLLRSTPAICFARPNLQLAQCYVQQSSTTSE